MVHRESPPSVARPVRTTKTNREITLIQTQSTKQIPNFYGRYKANEFKDVPVNKALLGEEGTNSNLQEAPRKILASIGRRCPHGLPLDTARSGASAYRANCGHTSSSFLRGGGVSAGASGWVHDLHAGVSEPSTPVFSIGTGLDAVSVELFHHLGAKFPIASSGGRWLGR